MNLAKNRTCSSRLQVRHAEQAISLEELQNSLEFLKKKEANSFTSAKNEHENKKNNSVYIVSLISFFCFLHFS